ncbi:uncharacterized protein PHACADRAFT_202309 [Phanerochaete carnosa HHB-10118-sp]|uniref:DUF659 domain-containing protein n=1 Tax=Phanerochaete carnosa (strain HHB-10118-sp) TaxID=650164 RepID=K5WFC7_PHACS|nr:uncharacterized protein PHACADRAFT_202309 [Phanerochaete carnosa HHB-10118-sp]EKM48857.1 hypothetical protein PHACADRAFT_202309 [Phanerochaete carnosa HHB-10118-sp]
MRTTVNNWGKLFSKWWIVLVSPIGHITCDNTSNNGTMLDEFSQQVERKTGIDWDPVAQRINCLAHVINLATQALISTYSPAPHYNLHDPSTVEDSVSSSQDEIGLIRAIAVKDIGDVVFNNSAPTDTTHTQEQYKYHKDLSSANQHKKNSFEKGTGLTKKPGLEKNKSNK